MEQWKDIVNYEGLYQVSNLGRVKRIAGYSNQYRKFNKNIDRVLKPSVKDNDYLFVTLSKQGKLKRFYIHRLVANAFVPNPQNKPTVNHKDYNRKNNNVDNLEWNTYFENNEYSLKNRPDMHNKIRCKKVYQYDLEDNLLKIYPSMREAQRQTGISAIDVVCRGKRQKKKRQVTAGGYKWKYEEDVA